MITTRLRATALAATLGLASLSPVQTGLAALGLSLLVSGQAMAQSTIPCVGTVVKKNPGAGIVKSAKSDDNGSFAFQGLEAGNYRVCLENGTGCADTTVGKNGTIHGLTVFDEDRAKASKKHNYVGHVTLLR